MVEEINTVGGELGLFLNQSDIVDDIILQLVSQIAHLLAIRSFEQARIRTALFMLYIRICLKTEWYRVNMEVEGTVKNKKVKLLHKSIDLLKEYKDKEVIDNIEYNINGNALPNCNPDIVLKELENAIIKLN